MGRSIPRKRRPAWPPYDYVAGTRDLSANLLFLTPFVFIYALALLATRGEAENAAAAWLRAAVAGLGRPAATLAVCGVALGLGAAVWVRARRAPGQGGLFGGMLLEGLCYGGLLGLGAHLLAGAMPMGRMAELGSGVLLEGLRQDVRGLGLAAGAGVFEEVVFRGGALAGLLLLLRHAVGMDRYSAAALALLASAWVFSDYHHWGPGGEPYDPRVFAFRFHAGVLLGLVYLGRGLGIAALAHGFYDALVLLGR